jgi:hypothetical protein
MKKIFSLLIGFLFLLTSQVYGVESKQKEREFFFTYIGPLVSVGHGHIWHNYWSGTSRISEVNNGFFVSGGVIFSVFAKNLSGSLSIQYIFSFNSDHYLQHLLYKMSGKYMFQITPIFQIGVGAGAYFESPPSDYNYQGGAGALLPVEFAIAPTETTRLVIDIFATFGWYGLGEDSVKLGYGVDIAFIFRVGQN